jgi:hypothetical protein
MAPGIPPGLFGNTFLNNLGVIVFTGVFIGYAITLLIVLFLPHVNAAFAGRALGPPKPDEYDN